MTRTLTMQLQFHHAFGAGGLMEVTDGDELIEDAIQIICEKLRADEAPPGTWYTIDIRRKEQDQ